jgi:hypothetical protein
MEVHIKMVQNVINPDNKLSDIQISPPDINIRVIFTILIPTGRLFDTIVGVEY